MLTVSSWDEHYIDNITFLRTYRLLVNKFQQGREGSVFEPHVESMDIPMALWTVGVACIVANIGGYAHPGVAGVYAALMFYIPQQVAFYLLLSNGKFRMGSPSVGYTAFPAVMAVYLAASVMFLMATTSDDRRWSITDVIMGVTLAMAGSYMSWVSTATGGVTANYATNVRRTLFDPVPAD